MRCGWPLQAVLGNARGRCDARASVSSSNLRRRRMIGGIAWARVAVCAASVSLLAGTAHAQQQQDLGPRPVKVADTPYTFDTAEQHGIKVSVVVRGLAHPFSFAFLPNGDALVVERSAGLRLVRNVASGRGGAATLEAQPIGGTPERYTQRTSG